MSTAEYLPLKPSWEKVVKIPQTTENWLKVYGMKANKLTWPHVAAKLGFKKKSGHVTTLHQSVESRYGDGLFTQYCTSPDAVYQLTADLQQIESIEQQVIAQLVKLKARRKWLQSGSRAKFGVLLAQRPVLVLAASASHAPLLCGLVAAVCREQGAHCLSLNLVDCQGGAAAWRENMAAPSPDSIVAATDWLEGRAKQAASLGRGGLSFSSIQEGLTLALAQQEADAVYLVAHDDVCLKGYAELVAMVKKFPIPLNVVSVNSKQPETLDRMRSLAALAHGSCHSHQSSPGPDAPALTREDEVLLDRELDRAKTVLAEVQALRMDVRERNAAPDSSVQTGRVLAEVRDEEFMTSVQWLSGQGLRARQLTFERLVESLAFRHCEGVLRHSSSTSLGGGAGEVAVVPSYQLVQARYCAGFVHLRWRDGSVVHVHLTPPLARDFQRRIEAAVQLYRQRVAWLRQGSRELFGTLLEDCVVVVVDTSASMRLHLPLLKHKFHQLVREQLCHKRQFTVVQCGSKPRPWRARLVPVGVQTLEQAGQWVEALQADGSSNLMDALQLATAIPGTQGLYLLTDGRPDQAASTVLAARQSWPTVPLHTISFNCADSSANHFLAQLSADSGGRYHYFADDLQDSNGPVPYKSADVRALLDEIEAAQHQLVKVQQLEVECAQVTAAAGNLGEEEQRGESPPVPPDDSCSEDGGTSVSKETNIKGKPLKLMSSKRWLQKNGLAAKRLTLADALGPSAVPHTPSKPLPHSGARVYGKVLRAVLPVGHLSADDQVTLIHPSEPDLRSFRSRLRSGIEECARRLNRLVRAALPTEQYRALRGSQQEEEQCSDSEAEGEGEVDYLRCKKAIFSCLAALEWPRKKEDFVLLESEVKEGQKTLEYLSALLQKEKQPKALNREGAHSISQASSPSTSCKSSPPTSCKSSPPTSCESSPPTSRASSPPTSEASLHSVSTACSTASLEEKEEESNSSRRRLQATGSSTPQPRQPPLKKGTLVLAQSSADGFFYQGRVAGSSRRRKSLVVEFPDGQREEVPLGSVLGVDGARPCPLLKISDVAMVRVRSKHSSHCKSHDGPCDLYVPCTVLKTPPLPHLSTAYYSCLAYNGKKVMCIRRHLVAISNRQYEQFTKEIVSKQHPVRRPLSPSCSVPSPQPLKQSSRRNGHGIAGRQQQSPSSGGGVPVPTPPGRSSGRTGQRKEEGRSRRSSAGTAGSPVSHTEPVPSTPPPLLPWQPLTPDHHLSTTTQLSTSRELPTKHHEIPSPGLSAEMRSHASTPQAPPLMQDVGVQAVELCERASSPVQFPCSVAVNTEAVQERGTCTGPLTADYGTNTEWRGREQEWAGPPVPPHGHHQLSSPSSSSSPPCERGRGEADMPLGGVLPAQTASLGSAAQCEGGDTLTAAGTGTELGKAGEQIAMPTDKIRQSVDQTNEPRDQTYESRDQTNKPRDKINEPLDKTNEPGDQTNEPGDLTNEPVDLTNEPVDLTNEPAGTTNQHNPSYLIDQTATAGGFRPPRTSTPTTPIPVLARWSTDGWYRRASVANDNRDGTYLVVDHQGSSDTVAVDDMIVTGSEDMSLPLPTGSYVIASHPRHRCYGPAQVTAYMFADQYAMVTWDDTSGSCRRLDMFVISQNKYESDVDNIVTKQQEWIGQGVVARGNDGFFYRGTVREYLQGQFMVMWLQSGEVGDVDSAHVFGPAQRRRVVRSGDHAVAFKSPQHHLAAPGRVLGRSGEKVDVVFCDGKRIPDIPGHNCLWVSPQYYQDCFDYILEQQQDSEHDETGDSSTLPTEE